MYDIKIKSNFSAAHNLKDYKGKCERLQGHNWIVEAVFSYETVDKSGLAIDFKDAKEALGAVLEKLDHAYLNDVTALGGINPTSENIAKSIYDDLKKKVRELKSVSVWENENSCATYSEGCPRTF